MAKQKKTKKKEERDASAFKQSTSSLGHQAKK
jgi:hypothetical protein